MLYECGGKFWAVWFRMSHVMFWCALIGQRHLLRSRRATEPLSWLKQDARKTQFLSVLGEIRLQFRHFWADLDQNQSKNCRILVKKSLFSLWASQKTGKTVKKRQNEFFGGLRWWAKAKNGFVWRGLGLWLWDRSPSASKYSIQVDLFT